MSQRLAREQVEALLYDLCVDLGFCSLGDGYDQLINSPPITVEEFANAVIEFDGPSPSLPNRVRNLVRMKVAEHFERAGLDATFTKLPIF